LKWEPLFVVGLGVALLLAGLVFKNPLYGLILLTAVSFVNTSSVSVLYEISELSLRVQDLLFALLAGALLVKGGITGSLSIPIELTRVFLAALVFISCIALSLLNVYGAFPDHFGYSAASFLRLGQYAFLIPLACMALKGEREVKRFVIIFVVFTLASVAVALVQGMSGSGLFSERLRVGALVGKNSLGLVSGLICLLGTIQYFERPFQARISLWVLLGGGFFGLILCKSASSMMATVAVVCLYRLFQYRRNILLVVRWGSVIFFGVVMFVLFVRFLRPAVLEGFFEMTGGSFVHRSIMGLTGIGIFFEHPLIGVGWRASSFPEILMSPELNGWLRSIFPDAPVQYFPDVRPTSVHSFYIQILAELGLIGIFVFLCMTAYLSRVIVKIIRELRPNSPLKAFGKFFGFALIFLLIWWMAQPLYGGQIETFLFFSFLGGLAAVARIGRQQV
jgi:hypothetical protein